MTSVRQLRLGRSCLALGIVPVFIFGLAGAPAVAADIDESMQGKALAWGIGQSQEHQIPEELKDAAIIDIAAGLNHSVALDSSGAVTVWGSNEYAQAEVPEFESMVRDVEAGANHTVALLADGTVAAWGREANKRTEVPAEAKDVIDIAAGGAASAALTRSGTLVTWGDNAFGQSLLPTELDSDPAVAVELGDGFSAVITEAGKIVTWGRSDRTQLDLPAIPNGEKVVQIDLGLAHGVALTDAGTVLTWGDNRADQTDLPEEITNATVVRVAAGGNQTAAILDDGTIIAWGDSQSDAGKIPAELAQHGVADVAFYEHHALALVDVEPVVPGEGGENPGDGDGDGDGGENPGTGNGDGGSTDDDGSDGSVTDGPDANVDGEMPVTGGVSWPLVIGASTLLAVGLGFILVRRFNGTDREDGSTGKFIKGATGTLVIAGLVASSLGVLPTAPASAASPVEYDSFRPGQEWLDNNGNAIQSHGGHVLPIEQADGSTLYHFYGEDRWNGYDEGRGIHLYTSTDLYNWTDRQMPLRTVVYRSDLDTDPYFKDLYADYTTEQKDAVYRDLGTTRMDPNVPAAVLERPKVMFNEATGMWVMWIHTDGPSTWSDAQYAKATGGVAVSESAYGPFRYVDSYRLHRAAPGEQNVAPNNPGMLRDMTVYVDPDGTGYLAYSSEENMTMFISKLSPSYMFVSSSVDKGVPGVDYTRAIHNGGRESPAIFFYDGLYYMITSGLTGWAPNAAEYATAESLLGTWTRHGNPAHGENANVTHHSQSTAVLPIDPENGEFIYLGNRWYPDDLRNSGHVWLPLKFESDGSMTMEWRDEWKLEDLKFMGKMEVSTTVPQAVNLGDKSVLPTEVEVNRKGEQPLVTEIQWHNAEVLDQIGPVTLSGYLPELGRDIQVDTMVVPQDVRYAVNAGGELGPEMDALLSLSDSARMLSSVADQKLGTDPGTGAEWGYLNDNTGAENPSGSWFESLRYVDKTASYKRLAYEFSDLEPGLHTVAMGVYDPWSQWANGKRQAWIKANDRQVDAWVPIDGKFRTLEYKDILVGEDGKLKLEMIPENQGENTDIQVSWMIISKN